MKTNPATIKYDGPVQNFEESQRIATSACPCLGNLHMTVPRTAERESADFLQPNPWQTSATTVVLG